MTERPPSSRWLGIGPGWHCLEVGAGSGSIARFMSERVGPTGRVVAIDINTDWIPASLAANVEVRRHDIGVDDLAKGAFDLVHERAVLTFVPEREAALTRMIAALKPGGCLLVEELVSPVTEAAATDGRDNELAQQSRRAIAEVLRRRGGDPVFAHRVAGLNSCRADRRRLRRLFRPHPYRSGGTTGEGQYRPNRCRDDRDRVDQFGGTGPIPRDSGPPGLSVSRIYGIDFRVGTAPAVIAFERRKHRGGCQR